MRFFIPFSTALTLGFLCWCFHTIGYLDGVDATRREAAVAGSGVYAISLLNGDHQWCWVVDGEVIKNKRDR